MESRRAMVTFSGKSLDWRIVLMVGKTRSENVNWDMVAVMAKMLGSNKERSSVSWT